MRNGLLTCFKSSEKNRYQNCLTVSNIQLANIVLDTFDNSSQKILANVIENPNNTSFDTESLIHGFIKDNIVLTAPCLKNIFTAIGIIPEIGTNIDAFPRQNTYVHGQVLLLPTMKV